MKFSRKIQQCELSPVRKFYPYEVAAEAKGLRIHHHEHRPAGHRDAQGLL